jgi:hypothetical protein
MQKSNWGATVARYITEGRTVSGGCGASSSEEQLQQAQTNLFDTLTADEGQEFADASQVFGQLSSQFSPILAAGINQQGYTPAEISQLNSQAATGTGQQAAMAKQAINSQIAAEGGAAALPSGAALEAATGVATGAGQQLANTELNTQEQSEALGRQNFLEAAGILGGAPGVFGTSNSAGGIATGAGSAAFKSAAQINAQNNSWVGDVMGVLGDATKLGSSALTGGGL